jgi:hypothetical protein
MRLLPPPITSDCATCGTTFSRSWFRPSQSSKYCSWKCRRTGAEIESIGSRIDSLMELRDSTNSEYVADTYLTMADSECARMKILTRWNDV